MNKQCFQDRLLPCLQEYGNSIAIRHESGEITYRELDKKAACFSNWLTAKNIKKETFIGICSEDKIDFIVAMIGIIKAGCVFVPLNPALPLKRIREMIRTTHTGLLFSDTVNKSRLSGDGSIDPEGLRIVTIEDSFYDTPGFQPAPAQKTEIQYHREDRLYVYFTSGTTGTPNAVLGKNKSLLHFVDWEIETFSIEKGCRISQLNSLEFDAFLRDVFVSLIAGGTLCIPGHKEITGNGRHLSDWLEQERIHLIHWGPDLLKLLNREDLNPHRFKYLKYILMAGAPVNTTELRKWYDTFGERIQLVNLYGPTETTMVKSFYFIGKKDAEKGKVSIGKAMKGCRMLILDKQMNLCPEMVVGEIYIRTPYRTFGYYNNPRLTQERFIPNPFSGDENDLFYKTGDLGRVLPDGNIEFVGRIDRQVKIKGVRVEPEEIEHIMLNLPGFDISEAVVTVRQDENGENELCAYYVSGSQLDTKKLQEYLSMVLPGSTVPADFIRLGVVPRLTNGKVDLKTLPLSEVADKKKEPTAPVDQVESELVGIWSEVLEIEKNTIGVEDEFVDIKGHSLKAIMISSKVHKLFNVSIPIQVIFDLSTIRKLAGYIKQSVKKTFSTIEPTPAKEYYAQSPAQKRLYILRRIDENSTGYNVPQIVSLEGDLQIERLEESFNKLIKRHESLRTSFDMIAGQPVQRIHEHVDFKITHYHLDANIAEKHPLPAASMEPGKAAIPAAECAAIDEIIAGFIRPFDLEEAPLLRVGLINRGRQKYILMVDMHHIISDMTSRAIFLQDFLSIYSGKELPELRLQYKDYSEWFNSEEQREAIKKQEQYWLAQFREEVPVLELPLDYTRPASMSYEGSSVEFAVDNAQLDSLQNLAQAENGTLFMIILAILNVLLSKLSGQEDILVGTPVIGRRHADLERIVGIFVNTLVLRNHPKGGKTFREFFKDLKERSLKAFENQDYQFEELVDRVAVNRDGNRNPLFDVIYSYQEVGKEADALFRDNEYDLNPAPYNYEDNIAKFDLTLGTAVGEDVFFSFQYCTKLFKRESVERFVAYFKKILGHVLEQPDTRLAEIEIISPEEKKRLLYEYNAGDCGYPSDQTIQGLFERQAARTPGNTAVVMPRLFSQSGQETLHSKSMQYKELNRKADQLALLLRAKGAGRGSLVGISLAPSFELIAGILAILKAGAGYLPIDYDYPLERIRHMLEDSGTQLLLASRDLVNITKAAVNREITDPADEVAGEFEYDAASTNPEPRNLPTDVAYVIYTSGTTGKPKGAVIEHKNVVSLMFNDRFRFDFNSSDVWTMFHSFCFDFSVWEMYGALLYGGQLVMIPRPITREPGKYLDILKENRVTVLNQTPSAFYNLIDKELKQKNKELKLRYIIFGGEALKPIKLKEWHTRYPDVKLINMFGITETTVHVTFKEITEKEIETNLNNIGKPLPVVTSYIVDRNIKLRPAGLSGEILVGGEGVGRGYLNRPELTAERFINNPYKPEERLYRSGDAGRFLENGEIEYFGRIDLQVQIRGYRIELGEIEYQLLKYSQIKEAAVKAIDDHEGEKSLCAYIVSNSDINISQLREYLTGTLPSYMVPSLFVRLDKIPLTVNGKVNYKALPKPAESGQAKVGGDDALPGNEVERILVNICGQVLGRKHIGIHENFFEIGGDSIKLIQIASRLAEAGYKVEIREFFTYPSIAELSPFIRKVKVAAVQSPVTGTIPLTPIQDAFFKTPGNPVHHFNQAVMFYSEEGFEENAVRAIFQKIQEHHDALRMIYEEKDGGMIQTNQGLDYPLSLQAYDLKGEKEPVKAMEQRANELQASIDLEKGPLMRLGLFHLDDGDRLLIVIHHLVIDGVSWRVLFEDIASLYQQYKKGTNLELPLKSYSFKMWAEKLSVYADTETFLAEKAYWSALESQTVPGIEKDFAVEESAIKDSETISFSLDEKTTGLLLTKANEAFGTEVKDLLLTALDLAVQGHFGITRLLIDMEGHGREELFADIDITRTVGWFTSVYPVILDFSYEKNRARQLKEVKETLRRIPHNGIGYGILKYLTAAEHKKELEFKLKPRFIFNYLGRFDEDIRQLAFPIARESTGCSQDPGGRRKYEFDVSGMVVDKQLVMSVTYSKKQFRAQTVRDLSNRYQTELEQLISYCAARDERQLTPGDLTYRELSIELLDRLNQRYSGSIADIYPLTPMQEGMLFHTLLEENTAMFLERTSYRLQGDLDTNLVEQSLNELLKRYEILRAAFIHDTLERPLQVVLKNRQVDFCHRDLRRITPESKRERVIREFKERDSQLAFDLSKDALIRVAVFRVNDREYEFSWTHHHILMDGWCIGILISEYFEIYNSLVRNTTYSLPTVKPYRTYIRWLENQSRDDANFFWTHYLTGYEELTTVPKIKSPLDTAGGYKNDEVVFKIEKENTARLTALAAKNQVTLNTVIQACWGIILSKYNNTEDVCFGAVVSGRPAEISGVESMVGLFINTVPVRILCENTLRFKDLLKQIQKRAIDSEKYHYYPLTEIQSHSLLKQRLIDHILAFENYPVVEQIAGAADINAENNDRVALDVSDVERFNQVNYDLNVVIEPLIELGFRFKFNANIYEREWVQFIAGHVRRLLEQVLDNEKQTIGQLTLLSEKEREQILFDFNRTETSKPMERTIHELFETQAARVPDHIAVNGPSGMTRSRPQRPDAVVQMSYGCLNEMANRLALLLRQKGVATDCLVGLMVERSLEMVTGMMAILKAGGAYIPIDPEHPGDRIKYILDDTQAHVMVLQQHLAEEKQELLREYFPGNIIAVDDLVNYQVETGKPGTIETAADRGAEYLAYIIYTSGSTGKPKGVCIEHASIANSLSWRSNHYRFNEYEVILQMSAFSFDGSVMDIFSTLISGAKLVVVEQHNRNNLDYLLRIIENNSVTHFLIVPGFYKIFLEEIHQSLKKSLKSVTVVGDSFTEELVNTHFEKLPGVKLFNEYGPTENSVCSTVHQFDPQNRRILIGKPISNVSCYITDRNGRLNPVGIPGELCVAGTGLARNYLNKPGLSAEKFIINPYIAGKRIYRTGDLARWMPDGNLEFLGRVDRQVKIRGFRVELGEIENRLLKHNLIKDVVVLPRTIESGHTPDQTGDKFLCAYIVPAEGKVFADELSMADQLRTYLSQVMPVYMVPSHFTALQEIPLTPTGKVDWRALPAPKTTAKTGNQTKPGDIVEEKVAEIWAGLLGIEKESIAVESNFFDLGGHSLKAIVLVSELHKKLNVKLSLAEVFKRPVLKNLADYIKQLPQNKYASIEPAEEKEYYPLSSAQNRMYILQQMELDSTIYNVPEIVELEIEPDRSKLETVFKRLIQRHETLRTSFITIDGRPMQKIHPEVTFAVEYYDLEAGDSTPDIDRAIMDFVRPFNMPAAPLFRVGIIKLEQNKHVLLVDMHHIISDAISQQIMIREFLALYNGESLPPLRLQYKDFSEWQGSKNEQEAIMRQKEYWLKKFAGEVPVLNIPTDYPRPVKLGFAGNSLRFNVEWNLYAKIRALISQQEVTLNIYLLAVYTIFLSQYTGQEDIVVGTVVAGREHADLENIIGFFVNMLPMRNQPAEDMTFEEFLEEVKENAVAAYANQSYPFEELVNSLDMERLPGRHPLVDCVFVMHNVDAEVAGLALPGSGDSRKNSFKRAHFDLMFHATAGTDAISILIEYSTTLFKHTTVEEMPARFLDILGQVVQDKTIRLKDIACSHDFATIESSALQTEDIDFEF
jgi:amino acid adenylation domain-containing protein/non-ribosomal peptide synthase protein (TIGR01720 family)